MGPSLVGPQFSNPAYTSSFITHILKSFVRFLVAVNYLSSFNSHNFLLLDSWKFSQGMKSWRTLYHPFQYGWILFNSPRTWNTSFIISTTWSDRYDHEETMNPKDKYIRAKNAKAIPSSITSHLDNLECDVAYPKALRHGEKGQINPQKSYTKMDLT